MFLCIASDREAERPVWDAVPPAPGGGQGAPWWSLLHGLPVLRPLRDQTSPHLTRTPLDITSYRVHSCLSNNSLTPYSTQTYRTTVLSWVSGSVLQFALYICLHMSQSDFFKWTDFYVNWPMVVKGIAGIRDTLDRWFHYWVNPIFISVYLAFLLPMSVFKHIHSLSQFLIREELTEFHSIKW